MIPASARALSVGFYSPQQTESMIRYVIGVDSVLITDGTYFVACAGETIIGCGGWSRRKTLFGGDQMKGGADDMLDPEVDAARIRAFFVDPGWARRGIGRRLIELCEAAAREHGFRRMELAATLPGEPLYRALGYSVTRRFDLILPDGVALPLAEMSKAL